MQRILVQLSLISLMCACLFACNTKPKKPLAQPVTQATPQVPELEETPVPVSPVDSLQKEIDKLRQEIAELEDSYPPASAQWPENAEEKEVIITPLVINRLDNGLVEISKDHFIAREKSLNARLPRSNYEAERARITVAIVQKKLEVVKLMLQEDTAQAKADMLDLEAGWKTLGETKAQIEIAKTALEQSKKQLQAAAVKIKEAKRKYNLPE